MVTIFSSNSPPESQLAYFQNDKLLFKKHKNKKQADCRQEMGSEQPSPVSKSPLCRLCLCSATTTSHHFLPRSQRTRVIIPAAARRLFWAFVETTDAVVFLRRTVWNTNYPHISVEDAIIFLLEPSLTFTARPSQHTAERKVCDLLYSRPGHYTR